MVSFQTNLYNKLKEGIGKLEMGKFEEVSFYQMYRRIYELERNNKAVLACQLLEESIMRKATQIMKDLKKVEDGQLISEFTRLGLEFKNFFLYLNSLSVYLNTKFFIPNKLKTIEEKAKVKFCDAFAEEAMLKSRVQKALMKEIFSLQIDKPKIKQFLDLLMNFHFNKLYVAFFEEKFLLKVKELYKSKFDEIFASCSYADYILEVSRFAKEQMQKETILHNTTKFKMIQLVKDCFVTSNHVCLIIKDSETGFFSFLKNSNYKVLKTLFALTEKSPHTLNLVEIFQQYLTFESKQIFDFSLSVDSCENANLSTYMNKVLALITKTERLSRIWSAKLSLGELFYRQNPSFILNLSLYYEDLFQRNLIRCYDDLRRMKIFALISLVKHKPEFESLFIRVIERRLILGKLFNFEVHFLTSKNDSLFTEKMRIRIIQMMHDYKMKTLNSSYKGTADFIITPTIFKGKIWPFSEIKQEVKWPEVLTEKMNHINEKSALKTNGSAALILPRRTNKKSRLKFSIEYNYFEFEITQLNRNLRFKGDGYDMLIVLLFNEHDNLDFDQIKQLTKIDEKLMELALEKLTRTPNKLLDVIESDGITTYRLRDISDEEFFKMKNAVIDEASRTNSD